MLMLTPNELRCLSPPALPVPCAPPLLPQVLLEKGVDESRILFLTVIAAPEGIRRICGTYPRIKVLTSEIDEGMEALHVVPGGSGASAGWVWACCVVRSGEGHGEGAIGA